jgi:hypothetical protein
MRDNTAVQPREIYRHVAPHLKAIEQARASAPPEIAKTLGIGRASVYSVLEAGQ